MKRLKIQTLLFAALVGLASTCFVSCGSSDGTETHQHRLLQRVLVGRRQHQPIAAQADTALQQDYGSEVIRLADGSYREDS